MVLSHMFFEKQFFYTDRGEQDNIQDICVKLFLYCSLGISLLVHIGSFREEDTARHT